MATYRGTTWSLVLLKRTTIIDFALWTRNSVRYSLISIFTSKPLNFVMQPVLIVLSCRGWWGNKVIIKKATLSTHLVNKKNWYKSIKLSMFCCNPGKHIFFADWQFCFFAAFAFEVLVVGWEIRSEWEASYWSHAVQFWKNPKWAKTHLSFGTLAHLSVTHFKVQLLYQLCVRWHSSLMHTAAAAAAAR